MMVGLPGIEPGSHAPEACIIAFIPQPVVSGSGVDLRGLEPLTSAMRMQRSTRWATSPGCEIVGVPGIEPGLHAPHACVLPVYYTPKKHDSNSVKIFWGEVKFLGQG